MSTQLVFWLASSSARVYPGTLPPRAGLDGLEGALNEQFSFQVPVRNLGPTPVSVRLEIAGPDGWQVRVRAVGYVPLRHHNTPVAGCDLDVEGRGRIPGFVPDPLFDEDTILVPSLETHAFWVTVRPGRSAEPGRHAIKLHLAPEGVRKIAHSVPIRLHDLVLQPRKNFSITQWFYADALIDWYKTDLFDDRFWEVLASYVSDMVEHGQDTLYVPVFTPPLDGVKRPSQLLHVVRSGKDRYRFDWRDVRKYVATLKTRGMRNFEWCHPFTQWGVKHAIRVYEGQGRDERLLWKPETGATSPIYRRFLAQYLPELHRFLSVEKLLGRSYFHVSDEPHGEEHLANYTAARTVLAELAPWMKVMDALSEIAYGRQKLTDMPVPSIKTALDFVAEGIPCWCYYCCGPRDKFLNRLMDTPLAKIAMHGFLFYRWPFQGFLHWGYNYWYRRQTRELIDPYHVQDAHAWPGWAYGDAFAVYPGANGPVDSVRWEIFGESLQDYRLLQTLGVERTAPLLRAVRSFEDFPKTETWRRAARGRLLSMAGKKKSG